MHKRGFTLLELIIVIIVIAVLASIALPKLFQAVESTRAVEALASIASLRRSMETCSLMSGENYTDCHLNWCSKPDTLVAEDPSRSPGAHFTYIAYPYDSGRYGVAAYRSIKDGGNGCSFIFYESSSGCICGTGPFRARSTAACAGGCMDNCGGSGYVLPGQRCL